MEDIRTAFNSFKTSVTQGESIPFKKVLEMVSKQLNGTPSEEQITQLETLVQSEVFTASDQYFKDFITDNLSRVSGFPGNDLEKFLQKRVSSALYSYLQPHMERVKTRIANYSVFVVLHELFQKDRSVDAVKKLVGRLNGEQKSYLDYLKQNPKLTSEQAVNSWGARSSYSEFG